MKAKIKNMIKEAIYQKENGVSEWEIIKSVHMRLGELLIYDNSYSNKIQETYIDETGQKVDLETDISRKRKEKLIEENTSTNEIQQICKGMAEIPAAILSKVGIEAKVIGVEKKGDVDGEKRENGEIIDVPEIYTVSFDDDQNIKVGENQKRNDKKSGHYCVLVKSSQEEYIQDFLIDTALARIKCGEPSRDGNVPGICKISEYKERSIKGLPLNIEFGQDLKKDFDKYQSQQSKTMGITDKFNFVFQKLREVDAKCGFEEANDIVKMEMKALLTEEEASNFQNQLKICNLVKEDKNTCDVICIYGIAGANYIVKSDENVIGDVISGRASFDDIQAVLWNGFKPRKTLDGRSLNEMLGIKKKELEKKTEIAPEKEVEREL